MREEDRSVATQEQENVNKDEMKNPHVAAVHSKSRNVNVGGGHALAHATRPGAAQAT